MVKICIIIIGAIRLECDFIAENIQNIRDHFAGYDVTTIFATWNPINKIYITHGVNYYYDYDKDKLTETIAPLVDNLLFMNNLEINNVPKLQNGMPPLFMYQLGYVKEFIINNNLNFDYIIKTRNDIQIKIDDIPNYLNSNVYIPPAYWRTEPLNLLNDHFFIMPFKLFKTIDISLQNVIDTTPTCNDCEELNFKLIKPNIVIDKKCMIYYKTFGGCKISIDNSAK